MSRYRGLLVAAVAVTLLTGLAQALLPAHPPAPASVAANAHTVGELLRQRAQAIIGRDEAAFLAGIDPEAAPGLLEAQKALFHNLAAVPLRVWDYQLDGDRVRLVYRLAEVDTEPVTKALGYRFVQRGVRWYLAADEPNERSPWDFGPCHVLTGSGGLVLSHPGGEALAARVLAELDGAVAAVTEVWGTDWARKVAIVIPANADEMRALVGPSFTDVAGVAVADRADPPAGQRVVLHPERAAFLSPQELRVLLRHEITHIAARGATADGAPMWLLEGFADYVGLRGSGLSMRDAAPKLTADVTALPRDEDFRGEHAEVAYQQAWSVNVYLAELLGEKGLVALYRTLARKSEVDGVVDVAGWRAFLRERIG